MDLYSTATSLLDLVTQQLTSLGVVIPERVYVAPGADIAFDCEQLTVNLSRIISNFQGADTPYPVQQHKILRKSAEYSITLCRCVPTLNDNGTAPSTEALGDAANITMLDMVSLRRAIETIEHQHLLVPRNVPVSLGQAQALGPQGGIASAQIMYTVELVDNDAGWVG